MYWYEDDIKRIEKQPKALANEASVIFYGSSSIRMWDYLAADFPNYKTVNLGFGGSTLAACAWFLDRVMEGHQPKALVVYAGDNDLGDGRHPEEVFLFFQQLVANVSHRFGNIPCFFVSLKPSLARWAISDQFRYANTLIQTEITESNGNWKFIDIFSPMLNKSGVPMANLYDLDGLHMSRAGYELWRDIIAPAITM